MAIASLSAAACRKVHLQPGTGGLRVSVGGLPRGAVAEVWVSPRYSTERAFTPRHQTVHGSDALFVDLPPEGYRVAVNDAQGRGGYYGTWGGVDTILVRSGEIASARVSLANGIGARGRVLDAITRAPLGNTYVAPPTRTAGDRWPVALPWYWTASDQTGAFVLGGLPGDYDERHRELVRIWFQHAGYVSRSLALGDGHGHPDPRAGNWTVLLEPSSSETLTLDAQFTALRIVAGGAAARLGMQVGDRVVAIDRADVDPPRAMLPLLDGDSPDRVHHTLDERPTTVVMRVLRGNASVDLRAVLADPPPE